MLLLLLLTLPLLPLRRCHLNQYPLGPCSSPDCLSNWVPSARLPFPSSNARPAVNGWVVMQGTWTCASGYSGCCFRTQGLCFRADSLSCKHEYSCAYPSSIQLWHANQNSSLQHRELLERERERERAAQHPEAEMRASNTVTSTWTSEVNRAGCIMQALCNYRLEVMQVGSKQL